MIKYFKKPRSDRLHITSSIYHHPSNIYLASTPRRQVTPFSSCDICSFIETKNPHIVPFNRIDVGITTSYIIHRSIPHPSPQSDTIAN